MHVIVGVGLIALAAILFQVAYILHRMPAAKRWLRNELTSSFMCFVVLIALAGGVATLAEGAISEKSASSSYDGTALAGLAVLAVVVVVGFVVMRRRGRQIGGTPA